jgi:hypothetical protein
MKKPAGKASIRYVRRHAIFDWIRLAVQACIALTGGSRIVMFNYARPKTAALPRYFSYQGIPTVRITDVGAATV